MCTTITRLLFHSMGDYEQKQQRLLNLWRDIRDEEEIFDEEDDDNEDIVEADLDHNTYEAQSADEVDEPFVQDLTDDVPLQQDHDEALQTDNFIDPRLHYVGKDKTTKWNKIPPNKDITKTKRANIFKERPGPKKRARLTITIIY